MQLLAVIGFSFYAVTHIGAVVVAFRSKKPFTGTSTWVGDENLRYPYPARNGVLGDWF